MSFLVLLGSSAIVLAQPLYKWVESDGSITFSVTPPAAGIDYETVSAKGSDQSLANAPAAAKAPALQQILPSATPSRVPTQRLAPQQGIQAGIESSAGVSQANAPTLPAGYSEKQARSVIGTKTSRTPEESRRLNDGSVTGMARSRKQRQCEDLKKRVVSLERRLKTRLTPEDMDNTVIHMARYQRSYDQHCVQ
ncbi:MAG: DUF4124 domain-containing protein [Granulosicoccus sp.]